MSSYGYESELGLDNANPNPMDPISKDHLYDWEEEEEEEEEMTEMKSRYSENMNTGLFRLYWSWWMAYRCFLSVNLRSRLDSIEQFELLVILCICQIDNI